MLISQKKDMRDMERRMKIRHNMVGSAAITVLAAVNVYASSQANTRKGSKNVPRDRKCVYQIFRELGYNNVRKSYRMYQESFWQLHRMLLKSDVTKK